MGVRTIALAVDMALGLVFHIVVVLAAVMAAPDPLKHGAKLFPLSDGNDFDQGVILGILTRKAV